MPTQSNDLSAQETVKLLVGDEQLLHSDWSSYEIDSDLMIPADAWHMTLGMSGNEMPPEVAPAVKVLVQIGEKTVLTGRVDEVTHSIAKTSHAYSISGRDQAAVLLDCAAPIFNKNEASLDEIVTALVSDFKLAKPRIHADAVLSRKKMVVDPGETAWNALARVAEACGVWPWFDPDGTLVIGGPDYSVEPTATLVLSRDGQGNNVLSLSKSDSVAERFSKVTVYNQAPGTQHQKGQHDVNGCDDDKLLAPLWTRPRIVIDHEAHNKADCKARATKLINDASLHGFTLTAVVQGHHADPEKKVLWQPGQRIRVQALPLGIDNEVFFLMGRKFTRSRNEGTRTELRLKKDGLWAVGAYPAKAGGAK